MSSTAILVTVVNRKSLLLPGIELQSSSLSLFTVLTAFGTVTRLPAARPRNRGAISSRVKKFFCYPKCLGWVWSPPSLLFSAYRGPFP
jgi:hypothetical protein